MGEKQRYDGYFTVEAALIMPMVLLFMTTMLYAAFYVYDRCMLEQCAYQAALRGSSNLNRTNEAAYKAAENAAVSLVTDKIYAASDLSYFITVTATEVSVEYDCKVNIPMLGWLSEYIKDLDFGIHTVKNVPRSRQVRLIRLMNRINNLIQ